MTSGFVILSIADRNRVMIIERAIRAAMSDEHIEGCNLAFRIFKNLKDDGYSLEHETSFAFRAQQTLREIWIVAAGIVAMYIAVLYFFWGRG